MIRFLLIVIFVVGFIEMVSINLCFKCEMLVGNIFGFALAVIELLMGIVWNCINNKNNKKLRLRG